MAKFELRIGLRPKVFEGFKDLSLSRSIEAISSSFRFSFSDQWTSENDPWPLNPQESVEIRIDDVLICKGFIDSLQGELTDTSRSYTIQGRDAVADIIDCSAPLQFGEMRNLTLKQICDKLSSGLLIKFEEGPGTWNKGKIPYHKVNEGETIFDAISSAAHKVGALLLPNGSGGVLITNVGNKKSDIKLIEGENAKEFSFTRDFSERYSNYRTAGQGKTAKKGEKTSWASQGFPKGTAPKATTGSTGTAAMPAANVIDRGVIRYRPLLIRVEGAADASMATKMCEFQAKTREAKSLEVSCTVQDWVKSPGKPWMINEEIQLVAPRLGIADLYGDVFIVAETEFTLSASGGAETRLRLLPKNAFMAEPQIDKKKRDTKAAGWASQGTTDVRKFVPEDEDAGGDD